MHLNIRSHHKIFAALAFATTAISYAPPSEAIPAFARKYKVECSACHSAMPYLNAEGRRFKEAGYRIVSEQGEVEDEMASAATEQISDTLAWDKVFPVSARFKGYVYDDVKGEEFKLRPSHEIEIFAAGNYWKEGSSSSRSREKTRTDLIPSWWGASAGTRSRARMSSSVIARSWRSTPTTRSRTEAAV